MNLYLTANQLTIIKRHAQATYPQECCGIIVGDPANHQVTDIHPVQNAWTPDCLPSEFATNAGHSHRDRYWIDPTDLLRVMKTSRTSGRSIIGIYHSHPDHPAIPSECDRQLAWPQYVYIIVSVQPQQVSDCLAWQLDAQQQFQPIDLVRWHTP